MTSSSLTLSCKYSCSALKNLKANRGGENSFGKNGWKTGSTVRARNPTTPMDTHVTLGGAEPGRATDPSSVEHLPCFATDTLPPPNTQNGSCKKGKSERLQLCSHTFSWRQLPAKSCCLRLSSPSPSSPLQRSSRGHPLPCAWNFTAASASEKYR